MYNKWFEHWWFHEPSMEEGVRNYCDGTIAFLKEKSMSNVPCWLFVIFYLLKTYFCLENSYDQSFILKISRYIFSSSGCCCCKNKKKGKTTKEMLFSWFCQAVLIMLASSSLFCRWILQIILSWGQWKLLFNKSATGIKETKFERADFTH